MNTSLLLIQDNFTLVRIPLTQKIEKTVFSAEFTGPYKLNDPLLILRGLEKFERMSPPEEGYPRKVFSNISRLRQGRRSWEAHRIVNHDLLMERSATNMPRRELSSFCSS